MTGKRILIIGGIIVGLLVLGLLFLTLTGPSVGNVFSSVVSSAPPGYYPEAPVAEDLLGRAEGGPAFLPTAAPFATQAATASGIGGGGGQGLAQVPVPQERLIIRTANVTLVVNDTAAAIDQIAEMANNMGGFLVGSNTYDIGDGTLRGDITIRVPAERFDEALDRLRGMAVEVQSESISGQDVTEEYVDLQARLGSLKAAEERLLEIMANAQNTSDLLQAEQQLTMRQAEIESIEGRVKYLEQSAALSLISVTLTPEITAQPVETGWRPLRTVREAFDSLVNGMTGIVDALIFIVIAVLPILLIIALLLSPFFFIGRAVWRRRRQRQ